MEHHFNTDHAVKYGIEEAIVINNLVFWITKNKANRKHYLNDRTWTYNTYKAFSEIFPYWNEHKIKRILDSLVNQGVILRENYNKSVLSIFSLSLIANFIDSNWSFILLQV